VPATALRRLPASTWFRIERAIEGSDTVVMLLAAMPIARSAGGRSIGMGDATPAGRHAAPARSATPGTECSPRHVIWKGDHDRTRRVAGVRGRASIGAARWSHEPSVEIVTAIVNAV
jgi:hypothetical protein